MTLPSAVPPSPARNVRHILRVVGWNLLFIFAGLLLIWIAGEAYWRLNGAFGNTHVHLGSRADHWRFVPGIGLLRPPHSDLVFTNGLDYWTVQRANSLGFLDREPIDPARAAASCHITIIGDSFVEAQEVPVSDKLQVRLEEIAAREAPHLDVTTSAFGIQRTGQVNQLPFYDRYARGMSPDLVVLVFVGNDFEDNSTERYALTPGHVPARLPYHQASRDGDGGVRLLPPVVDFDDAVFSRRSGSLNSWIRSATYRAANLSYFMRWLYIRTGLIDGNGDVYEHFQPAEDSVRRYQEWTNLVEGTVEGTMVMREEIEAWYFMSLGLEQFKRRADHDGAALMVLAINHVGGRSNPFYQELSDIAESLGIPVVSQHDYILSLGSQIEDADWKIDPHWVPAGHQWAAEAIWEHIEEKWEGKCPESEPQPDIVVDWISIGDPSDEVEYEDRIQTFQEPFGLRHRIHTPGGVAWVQIFPMFDSEGYRSVYEFVRSSRPTARLGWDMYVYDEGLTYVKEPCAWADVEHGFFLHVVPEDGSDLPAERQSAGFDNLGFRFSFRGAAFEGRCMVSADLPEYEIDYIRTGQLAAGSEAWSTRYNFALPEVMDAVQELMQSGREADIKASFDVYLDDRQLIYAKSPCNADDRDLSFFLHLFPADEKDLPSGREESSFDNLDFELMHKGGESDGSCFAAVDLPDYDIASIRTGQWVRGEGNVWEASIEFGK